MAQAQLPVDVIKQYPGPVQVLRSVKVIGWANTSSASLLRRRSRTTSILRGDRCGVQGAKRDTVERGVHRTAGRGYASYALPMRSTTLTTKGLDHTASVEQVAAPDVQGQARSGELQVLGSTWG